MLMKDCIQLLDVTKRYRKIEVVKNVSFQIEKGKLCAFLGANGAGKSTTMNMIITLLQKNSGKIYIEGLDIDKEKDSVKRKIGVVFQEDVLDPELDVYENLYYRGGLYIKEKNELEKRINKASELLSLQKVLRKKYKACSGGQKRLVQIARALLPEPKLLILDEPTVGLDPLAREQVWSVILKLNKEKNLTVFYSTHYVEEASNAEQVIMIHRGDLLLCKNVRELCESTSKEYVSRQLREVYMELLRKYEMLNL